MLRAAAPAARAWAASPSCSPSAADAGLGRRGPPLRDYGRRCRPRPGDVLVYHLAIGSVRGRLRCADRPEPLVVELPQPHAGRVLRAVGAAPSCTACTGAAASWPTLAAARPARRWPSPPSTRAELRRRRLPRAPRSRPILLDTAALRRASVDAGALGPPAGGQGGGRRRLALRRPHGARTSASTTWSRRSPPTAALYDPQARLHLVGGSSSPTLPGRRARLRPRRSGSADAVDAHRRRSPPASWPPTTGPPTCSSACPSTRASACRCSRPCTTGCRSWPSRAAAVPETLGGAGSCCPTSRPAVVAAAVAPGASPTRPCGTTWWPPATARLAELRLAADAGPAAPRCSRRCSTAAA